MCFLAGLGSALLVWGENFRDREREVQVEGRANSIPEYLPGKAVSGLLRADNSCLGEENISSVCFLGKVASVPTAGKATTGQRGHPAGSVAAPSSLYHSCTASFLLTKKESIQVIPKFQMSACQPSRESDHQAAWQFVVSNTCSVIQQTFLGNLSRTHHCTRYEGHRYGSDLGVSCL